MNTPTSEPPPPVDPQVLTLYQLAVEMADRVSARRNSANAFYLSLQTAAISVLGFATSFQANINHGVLIAICLVGIATAATWFLQLRSYRDLNRAKFAVINSLEEQLPVAIFTDEWASLERDPVAGWRKRYAELGTIERVVPAFFVILNGILAVYVAKL